MFVNEDDVRGGAATPGQACGAKMAAACLAAHFLAHGGHGPTRERAGGVGQEQRVGRGRVGTRACGRAGRARGPPPRVAAWGAGKPTPRAPGSRRHQGGGAVFARDLAVDAHAFRNLEPSGQRCAGRQHHAVPQRPAAERQPLFEPHAARIAQRARAQRPAPPLRRGVAAAVEARRALRLAPCQNGVGRGGALVPRSSRTLDPCRTVRMTGGCSCKQIPGQSTDGVEGVGARA